MLGKLWVVANKADRCAGKEEKKVREDQEHNSQPENNNNYFLLYTRWPYLK